MKEKWFTDTVTVYNKYRNPVTKKDDWKRFIVKGCLWLKATSKSVSDNNEVVIASSVDLMILVNEDYKTPQTWQNEPAGFTLQEGDLVVYGTCTDEVIEDLPISTIRKSNQSIDIRAVEIFDKPFMRNRHYEVMGV